MDYKRCIKCGSEKEISEFYKNKKCKDGHSGICIECQKKIVKESVSRRKQQVIEYQREYHRTHKSDAILRNLQYKAKIDRLKTPCVKCGEQRLYVIDFHHIDPSKKSFNIHRVTAKKNFKIIEDEVAKCVCLCRNCHAEFHTFYGQNPKNPEFALADFLGEPYGI